MRTDLTSKKIAVTGGSGFLGSHLLPLLREYGAFTRCLSRSGQIPCAVESVIGDCRDAQPMRKLLDGTDIFIHMASMLFGMSWQDYFRENIRAAAAISKVLQSLPESARPRKLIFISSLAAAGPSSTMPGKREEEEADPVSAYGWSKLWCEQALAAAPCAVFTVLRPPIIYGSGDRGLLPLFRSLKKGFGVSPGAFRKFPASVLHAKDAANAIALACGKDLPGVYHLSDNKYCDMDIFCQTAASALGRKNCAILRPPLPLMGAAACLSQGVGSLRAWASGKLGKKPPRPPHWNVDKFREASRNGWLADGALFVEKAGFVPEMNLASGMAETVGGYRSRGWL